MRELAALRPTPARIAQYRDAGLCLDVTPLADLRQWLNKTPDAVAISAHRAGRPSRDITFEEYADQVERYAGGLRDRGVGPGDRVALHLPNWWESHALVLACARVGAIAVPVAVETTPGERDRLVE